MNKTIYTRDLIAKTRKVLSESISHTQADEIARQAQSFTDAVAQLEDMGMSMRQAEAIAAKYHKMEEVDEVTDSTNKKIGAVQMDIEESVDAAELSKIAMNTGLSVEAIKALVVFTGVIGIPAAAAIAILAKDGLTKLIDKVKIKTKLS